AARGHWRAISALFTVAERRRDAAKSRTQTTCMTGMTRGPVSSVIAQDRRAARQCSTVAHRERRKTTLFEGLSSGATWIQMSDSQEWIPRTTATQLQFSASTRR